MRPAGRHGQGRFAAEGSPRQLIDRVLDQGGGRAALPARPSTRRSRPRLGGLAAAPRGAARPGPAVHRRRGRDPGRGRPAGPRPGKHPRAPLDPGGRVPPPHRAARSSTERPRRHRSRRRRRAVRRRAVGWPTPDVAPRRAYWGYQYKRTWRSSITTSFLYPVLYLAAMGVGLGSLVDQHSTPCRRGELPPASWRRACWRRRHADRRQRGHVPGDGRDQVDADLLRHAGDAADGATTCCSATWPGSRSASPSWCASTWR